MDSIRKKIDSEVVFGHGGRHATLAITAALRPVATSAANSSSNGWIFSSAPTIISVSSSLEANDSFCFIIGQSITFVGCTV